MSVGTTGPLGRCDAEVPGPRAGDATAPAGGTPPRPATRPAGRPQPAGSRPARPDDVRGPVRPAGRRAPAVLPAVRPRVAGGGAAPASGELRAPVGVAPVVLRRRRVAAVAVLGVLLGVLVGALLGFVVPPGAPAGPAPTGTTVAVVGAGESLSDVAGRVAPGADTGAVVTRIQELNGLQGSAVVPGRPLVVPAAG
ncbi:LysM peptidoglycan-binding domain-containing protein [Actinomycetospora flava]|uniref:LysM peptidoglycan-binding domain-containing protein n=1 Tax=Actinomycetospora flava TaxID=3129232 RepID=A0ABU8LZ13_9PSEU